MARVRIEDRAKHADYLAAMEKWREGKKAGSKREQPGRWRVRWYDLDRKEKAKTFTRLPAAEAFEQDVKNRIGDGTYRDPADGKTPFGTVAEEWFTSLVKPGRTTKHDYRQILDGYVLPKWGARQVASIKWGEISTWVSELIDNPGISGRKLSPARVIKIYRVFSMAMKHGVRSHRIGTSPCREHDLPRIEEDDEHVYLSHDQLESLADAAGPYRELILLLGYTGIRWGEASAIQVRRINLATRRLRIAKAYSDVQGVLEMGPVKNHEKRGVPLLVSMIGEIRPLMTGCKPDDLLFRAPEGGPLRYANFRKRVFDKAVNKAGLGELGITPHKLRHTAASLAIAAGADVKVVQKMLGHKSATMTLDLYGHLWPDRLDEVADRLDAGRSAALANRNALTAEGV